MEASQKEIRSEKSGASIKDSEITAEQFAGRDIINNYNPEAPSFVKVDLDYYGSSEYLSPIITKAVIDKVKKQRIILISGNSSFDKGSFIRHIGFKLCRKKGYDAHEVALNEDNASLYHVIRQGPKEIVYLLDGIHPQHVAYDLPRLQQMAESKSAYILMASELSISVWQPNQHVNTGFHFTIPKGELYKEDQLTIYLSSLLNSRKRLLSDQCKEALDRDLILGSEISVVAQKLSSPENANLFVNQLIFQQEVTEAELPDLIRAILDAGQGIMSKWYMTLNSKQKLIALGAVLLEGADDEQFFSVMKLITRGMWRYSHESLLALDYCDLDFLSDYFRFENLGTERQVLQSKYASQKTDVIRYAWHIHRRHLVSVLPIFVKLALSSLDTGSSDWDNFGNRQKRAGLRLMIAHSISEIGLVSSLSVENTLIELAANRDSRITRLVAISLALWREKGEDQKLFDLLQTWLEEERPRTIIAEYLDDNISELSSYLFQRNALTHLRISAIWALSYSAGYDTPNHLNQKIIDMLLNLLEEQEDLMVKSTFQLALPRMIQHHTIQLKDLLVSKFLMHEDMVEPVAIGLALAYLDYQEDIRLTIDNWFDQCFDKYSGKKAEGQIHNHNHVLLTVLKFYSLLEFSADSPNNITLISVYERLASVIKVRATEPVKRQIYETLSQVMVKDWTLAETHIPIILQKIDPILAIPIADEIFEIYCEQRLELKEGEHTFLWQNENYHIWLKPEMRPKTTIETRILNWVENEKPVMKQLATLATLRIAELFEIDEKHYVDELIRKLDEEKRQKENSIKELEWQERRAKHYGRIPPFTRFRIFFLLMFDSRVSKRRLKTILSLIYHYRVQVRRYRPQLRQLIRGWEQSEAAVIKKLSKWIRKLV